MLSIPSILLAITPTLVVILFAAAMCAFTGSIWFGVWVVWARICCVIFKE